MADSGSVLGIFAAAKEMLFGDLQSHDPEANISLGNRTSDL
jgi:hypothetical protein